MLQKTMTSSKFENTIDRYLNKLLDLDDYISIALLKFNTFGFCFGATSKNIRYMYNHCIYKCTLMYTDTYFKIFYNGLFYNLHFFSNTYKYFYNNYKFCSTHRTKIYIPREKFVNFFKIDGDLVSRDKLKRIDVSNGENYYTPHFINYNNLGRRVESHYNFCYNIDGKIKTILEHGTNVRYYVENKERIF